MIRRASSWLLALSVLYALMVTILSCPTPEQRRFQSRGEDRDHQRVQDAQGKELGRGSSYHSTSAPRA
eukprot:323619-Hanusia_phi.AAC.1